MAMILRSYWRSSCSWRVRIALNLKALEYRVHPVHLVANGGEQHADEHRELNPMRELPVLVVDGVPLSQSVAIIEYLDEQYPDPPLFPREPLARAHVRQMVEVVNSGTQPVQNLRVMQKLGRDFDLDRPVQVQWSRDWIQFGLGALERVVQQHGNGYCFGDEVTAADLCLVPQMYNARRFGVDLTQLPGLVAVDERLADHPAFMAAHPDQQPDAA